MRRRFENMCEWLSSGDWCDVQLFCGGRSFNAHRAVLASVSTFLRRILVSCPAEETPTCIFLPDFDLEAFSSVLYYVYNGEVAVQRHKLRNFLDVVKTLEIFVDLQCLQKRNFLENHDHDLVTYFLENSYTKNSDVFSLDSGGNSDHHYINIRKGEQNQDIHSQYSPDETDFRDKQAQFKHWTDLQPSLQNLPSFYSDRQKNSYLRDLFMETYPRNGNANGLTASVLAISNELYRAPASVLLTNANGKHPRADDIVSEITRKTTDHASHIACKENIFTESINCHKENVTKLFPDLIHSRSNDSITAFGDEGVKDNWTNLTSFNAQSPLAQLNMNEQLLQEVHLPSLDFNSTNGIAEPLQPAVMTPGQSSDALIQTAQQPVDENPCLETNQHLTRPSASIYNQVLENPWCPRLPFFLPTIKRNQSFIIDDKEVMGTLINDDNNNIQQPLSSSAQEIAEKVLCSDQTFKCAVCSQVFPSSESLVEHARRHSAVPARYTCGECGKTFSQLRNFKYHMSVHRGTREFAATCTVCGKYFNDRGYLSSHMKIHRNRKEYKCSMCPKSFNQRVAYNMHVRIHTGVKPHVCEQCGKAFSRKMLLKQHQRTHSGERPYACPHCDKRFADRSNMTLHLRLHTGVKPFSCSLCPKSFTKKHHLKSHLNFHTGAKPYSCPRCKLSFTQSSNMRTHFKKCNAQAPTENKDKPLKS